MTARSQVCLLSTLAIVSSVAHAHLEHLKTSLLTITALQRDLARLSDLMNRDFTEGDAGAAKSIRGEWSINTT
jgi:hypothetical protein